jgi:hypothetical protein
MTLFSSALHFAMRRKIVNNMYLLLPQNVLRVETLGFWPYTRRTHIVPVAR